jgi:hypothetical protein
MFISLADRFVATRIAGMFAYFGGAQQYLPGADRQSYQFVIAGLVPAISVGTLRALLTEMAGT